MYCACTTYVYTMYVELKAEKKKEKKKKEKKEKRSPRAQRWMSILILNISTSHIAELTAIMTETILL